ncbi:MAG: cation:dicarboxylate symporter family transporter [Zhenhengia sp.]|jgi:L-cystine uptake protein TcyP (sodium:dicarboxylate symporter family)|uniref:cation:dicarboxylate symporter family transporter n=1 Tax=Zhenhengia sp. TaxID=2944208 RepID=UPI0029151CD8|nr:cation:dicarboxylase symporter family transporter [Clostridiales bacterium]MDU6973197.1 cation:dicarboxylase symporter family transporter [Clostridiales bacterium]
MNSVFFTDFLMLSDLRTLLCIVLLVGLFAVMHRLQKKKVNFSKRMIIGTVLGLVLGLIIQFISGFSNDPMQITFVAETTKWYGLIGNGFIDLIRMLVIPLVMVSIIHVIINMKEGANIGKLTKNAMIVTMTMVIIAVLVGLGVGMAFGVGKGMAVVGGSAEIKEVTNVVDTLRGLLPANPVKAMVDVNIIALVIMAVFFGMGAKRMSKKYFDIVKPFFDLINALQKIIMSVAMTIIKYMPYAVIALLANTIAQRGLASILEVGIFIIALYVAVAIMFVIQLIALAIFGVNPVIYMKKALPVMILAFTSRSSVGALPLTIETLTDKLGVNDGTASFVAGFGTTAGMQGCAGVFPALLLIFVANVNGMPIDITFIAMSVIVVALGSLGIAGIPGTATMAASVALSGVGLASSFPVVSPILAIDPIVDMGRTLINVTGSMVNAIIVDRTLGQMDMEHFRKEVSK